MAWDDLGLALMRNGDVEQAIAPTRRAVDLQIKYPNLRLNWEQDNEALGRMLFDTGRFKQAIPYLQTAAELRPADQEIAKKLEQARKRAATQPGV
jgi:Flp pilus assembly protein TadD